MFQTSSYLSLVGPHVLTITSTQVTNLTVFTSLPPVTPSNLLLQQLLYMWSWEWQDCLPQSSHLNIKLADFITGTNCWANWTCSTAEEPETKSDFPPKLWFSAKLAGLQIPGWPAAWGQERWLKELAGFREAAWFGKKVAGVVGKSATPVLLTWRALGSAPGTWQLLPVFGKLRILYEMGGALASQGSLCNFPLTLFSYLKIFLKEFHSRIICSEY